MFIKSPSVHHKICSFGFQLYTTNFHYDSSCTPLFFRGGDKQSQAAENTDENSLANPSPPERVTKNRILEDVLWQELKSTGPLERLGTFGENVWKLAAVDPQWLLQVNGFRSRSSGKIYFCSVTLTVALATIVRTIWFRVGRPLFIVGDFRNLH